MQSPEHRTLTNETVAERTKEALERKGRGEAAQRLEVLPDETFRSAIARVARVEKSPEVRDLLEATLGTVAVLGQLSSLENQVERLALVRQFAEVLRVQATDLEKAAAHEIAKVANARLTGGPSPS